MFGIIKKNNFLILLVIVLLFAFLLRTIQLAQTPSGFHADEASFYVNAVALSQTGMDEDGNRVPFSLASFIDPKPALYSYLQIPFLYLFTNQIFAARFVSIVLAMLSLVAVYLFVQEFSDKKIALLTTAVLAVSPWHLIVSRGTQEVIASFLFLVTTLLCLTFFLKREKTNRIFLLCSFFFTSFLSMYFYHSAKVVLPFLVITLIAYHYKKTKTSFKNGVLVLILVIFAGVSSLLVQESSSRISAVSIFSDQGPQQKLLEQIYTSRGEISVSVIRVFYNKVQAYSLAVVGEYLKYFSPEFLFLSGSRPTRYIVPDHGLLYLIEIPLLLIGLYTAIKNRRKELALFLIILFVSPIPASLTTQETPSMLRSFPMIIALAYFIALGIKSVLEINNKLLKSLVIVLLLGAYVWSIFYFALQYHVQARYTKPWFRNSPYTKIAKEVALIAEDYEKIEITNDLRPLYAYFVMENLITIQELQVNPQARNTQKYTLGKFTFNKDVCDFDEIKPNTLYIAEVGCQEKNQELKNLTTVKVIAYDDGTEVYELLQLVQ